MSQKEIYSRYFRAHCKSIAEERLQLHWVRILVQITIYRRRRIGHLDQSDAYIVTCIRIRFRILFDTMHTDYYWLFYALDIPIPTPSI